MTDTKHPIQSTDSTDTRPDRLARRFMWGLAAALGLLVAPVVYLMVAPLVALLVIGALSCALVSLGPVIAMRWANWKLSAIVAESRRNPIPTLENELLARHAALRAARGHLQVALGQVEAFAAQAEEAARQYPDLAARWAASAFKARALAERKKRSYQDAAKALDAFERVVERCRTEWKLVVAEAALNSSLDGVLGDPMAALRSRTAIDGVTDRMNEAFAGLEIALLDDDPEVRNPVDSEALDRTVRRLA